MENMKLMNALCEIDIACDKTKTLLLKLLDDYEFADDFMPQINSLSTACVNAERGTSHWNAFKFLAGYYEIISFIQIIFDYVLQISKSARDAIESE